MPNKSLHRTGERTLVRDSAQNLAYVLDEADLENSCRFVQKADFKDLYEGPIFTQRATETDERFWIHSQER